MGRSLLLATLGVAAVAASTSTSVSTLSTTDEEQQQQQQHRQLNWNGDGYYPWNDDDGWDSGKSGKGGSSSSSGHGSWSPWSEGNNHWDGQPSWGYGKSGKSGSSSSGGWDNVWNGGWGQPGWWGHGDGKSGKSGSSSGVGWGGWNAGKSGKGGSSSSWGHGPWWGGQAWPSWGGWNDDGGWDSGKSGKSESSSSGGWDVVWNGGWGQPGWWGHSDGKSGKSGSSSGGGWGGWNAGKSGKSGSSSSWGHGPWWGGQAWPSWGGWGGKSSKSKSSKKGGHWVWVGPTWGNNWGWGHGKSGKSGSSGGWGDWGNWGGWGDWSLNGGSSSSKPDYKPESKPVSSSSSGHPTGWKDDGWDNDEYYKLDLTDIRAECNKLIEASERELLPKILRLVFHSCTGPDGCNGCVNLENVDNLGLKEPMEGILPLVQKYKGKLSRSDVWSVCAVEAASMAVNDGRSFALHYIGRQDCSDADEMGSGGSNPDMCSVDMTHSEMLTFFKDHFGMTDLKLIAAAMGVHSASTASRVNSGFGHLSGEEAGWVENAADYVLSQAYYTSILDHVWEIEKNENEYPVPNRFQWYHGEQFTGPIMTTADLSLVYDFEGYIEKDDHGDNGLVMCLTHPEAEFEIPGHGDRHIPLCPFAEETKEWVEYFADPNNSEDYFNTFEKALNVILYQ